MSVRSGMCSVDVGCEVKRVQRYCKTWMTSFHHQLPPGMRIEAVNQQEKTSREMFLSFGPQLDEMNGTSDPVWSWLTEQILSQNLCWLSVCSSLRTSYKTSAHRFIIWCPPYVTCDPLLMTRLAAVSWSAATLASTGSSVSFYILDWILSRSRIHFRCLMSWTPLLPFSPPEDFQWPW